MHFYKLALLLPFTLLLCSAQSTYYVTPTPDTPCPGEPCLSFVEHTRQGSGHLDNATLVFLPGNHTIESSIEIGDLTSLTLLGDPSSLPNITSRIVCSQPASVIFQCIENLFISALDISSCGSEDDASMYEYGFGYDYGSGGSTGAAKENTCGSEFYFQGAAVAAKSVRKLTISKCLFRNNTNYIGGALAVGDSTLTVSQATFEYNSASEYYGGGVYIEGSDANFTGNHFNNNQACKEGGGIYINNSVALFTENEFKNNQADYGGGGIYIAKSVANFTKNEFKNNQVINYQSGGGVYVVGSRAKFLNNNFVQNIATENGGALRVGFQSWIEFTGNVFINNSAMNGGGGAVFIGDSTVHFSGKTDFTTNSAQLFGGAIAIVNSSMSCHGDTTFINNTANSGGGIWVTDSYLTFAQNTTFQNNRAVNGGAVYAISSNLTTCEKMTFITNSATYGGAVYGEQCHLNFEGENTLIRNNASRDGGGLLLTSDSKCHLLPNTTVFFTYNTAMRNGGAIKVDVSNQLVYCLETSLTSALNECFFQLNSKATIKHERQLNDFNVIMYFSNNTAVEGGSDIYGGAVENCGLQNVKVSKSSDFESSGSVLNFITGNAPEALYVSSDPLRICICENNEAKCNSSITRQAYPGGKFSVSVIALGQRNGSVSAVIEADLTQHNIRFDSSQYIQNINNTCTNIEYTVFSSEEQTQEDVTLHAEGPCPPEGRSLEFKVEVLQCPHGFELSRNKSVCVCSNRLKKFTDTCAIENGTVLRPRGALFWVGYSNKSDGLISHPQCPFGYCTSEELYVSVDSSDTQCNYNRTGILCGKCLQDLSVVLGSYRCLQCPDSHLALLTAFAFAGIALVFFLFLLKLTVAVGTINGLIFYANVVQINSAVFFQPGNFNILTVFLAWLNLDLGIETCFYDGMDAYAKTWLQFVFPVYVLTLVGIIILFSHFSQRISSLLGTNPIAVLCTLYLLSYGKVLRTIIAAMSFANLEYPDGHIKVWRPDGNVTYLKGKHIPLVLVALCAFFLFIPYSLLLFCGQWLQGMPDSRVFSWINKPTIKSILDAYHAPYTSKHRYWTGLLLLIRSSLFIIYAFNVLRDPGLNLFCITTSALALITIGFVAEKIYANRYLGALEASFIINLGILAAATIAFGRLRALTYTSVSVAFVTFIGIVIYHSYLQLKDYELLKKIATLTTAIFHQKKKCTLNAEDVDKELTTSTQSIVSLREPLLEDEL